MKFIVERHSQVLPAWADYRRSLAEPPRLLTLDHHTDTSKPFRNHLRKTHGTDEATAEAERLSRLAAIDFRDPQSVEAALAIVSNDEHITTAIATDIISSAMVVAHNAMDTDLETYREHKIICRAVDRKPGSKNVAREDCDRVIESHFLDESINAFDVLLAAAGEASLSERPYILDIDLDYFTTWRSLAPHDHATLRSLARGAGLVTIATEPEYVRHCALDKDLTSDAILAKVEAILFT